MGELCAEELVGLADLVGNGGRTGGTVGPCPIGGGAVFQCRTLEWVVRNIPQKTRHDTHQWTCLSCETNFRS